MANTSSSKQAVRKKLRCFVAMAFDHEDTDAIYDKHIKKAITEVDMIPIRVDRVTHNDRIDAKIREEITRADIFVADLKKCNMATQY